MPAPATLDRQRREAHAPLYARADAMKRRLSDAIALDTIHAARLRTLRGKLASAIANANVAELTGFLALWTPCFETTIGDAQAAYLGEMAEAAE